MPAACAERVGYACLLRCAGSSDLAVAVCHPAQADRRESKRKRLRNSKHGLVLIAIGRACQHALPNVDASEISEIGCECGFRIRAGFVVSHEITRDAAMREAPEIFDTGNGFKGHDAGRTNIRKETDTA